MIRVDVVYTNVHWRSFTASHSYERCGISISPFSSYMTHSFPQSPNVRSFMEVVQDTLTNQQIAGSSQAYRNFSNLGHKKALPSSGGQVQTVSRRWLYSLGLSRPGTADYVISKNVFERFGIARRGIHDVARRVGSSRVQRALQQNAGARRAFSSENPRKKGGYLNWTF